MTENILPGNVKAELILADGELILLGGPGVDSVLYNLVLKYTLLKNV